MNKVRVLVGTRKGAFILSADAKREKWDIQGPYGSLPAAVIKGEEPFLIVGAIAGG